ncbi:MAG: pyridoxamine 5'-phosphate oxidase [Chloroflexi bacterium]|nr:pyridoxamine 5'-phosphate oxidase [Chloroflexota bacterium]
MTQIKNEALVYLDDHQVMTLATHGRMGLWAAAVFYVNDGFDFYFLSAGHTRHAQNIATQPQVAATIQEDYRDWQAIQGIQLEGEVRLVDGGLRDTAVSLYRHKYPFIARPKSQILMALKKVNWYRLKPEKLYFIDNQKGLGHRDLVIGVQ